MQDLRAPTLEEIRAARERLAGVTVRTPLVRLNVDDAPAEIWLKLENLQPIGSFKLRGAFNAMRLAGPELLAAGVYTASAGNMAQGVSWSARRLGVPATVVVPDHARRRRPGGFRRGEEGGLCDFRGQHRPGQAVHDPGGAGAVGLENQGQQGPKGHQGRQGHPVMGSPCR